MNPLNSVILEGHVVSKPEVKLVGKGTPVCDFVIGSNRSWKNEKGNFENEVSFIDIKSWGTLATACEKNCTKGRGIRVVGRLQQSRWKDNDGKMQSRLRIIAEHVEFRPDYKKNEAEALQSTPATVEETDLQNENAVLAMEAAANTPTQEKPEAIPF